MAQQWLLCAHDLVRGMYDFLSSSPTTDTVKLLADGDPASLYSPGATSASVELNLGGQYTVLGTAFCAHNLAPNTAKYSIDGYTAALGWQNAIAARFVPTTEDFAYLFPLPLTGCTRWRVNFTLATENIRLGIWSLLTDYGYAHDDVTPVTGESRGMLVLGSSSIEGGVQYPITRTIIPGIANVTGPGGFVQSQRFNTGCEEIQLTFRNMASGLDQPFDKLRRSCFGVRAVNSYVNPNWSKGAWLIGDEHDNSAVYRADYVRGAPGGALVYQITRPGGRADGVITLRTMPREV